MSDRGSILIERLVNETHMTVEDSSKRMSTVRLTDLATAHLIEALSKSLGLSLAKDIKDRDLATSTNVEL